MTSLPEKFSWAEDIYNPAEVTQHVHYITRAVKSEDAAGRRQALVDGLLSFGLRFRYMFSVIAESMGNPVELKVLQEELGDIFIHWIAGERLTNRPDENERRAQQAEILLKSEMEALKWFAARCLLSLPKGHPQRDTALAHSAFLGLLEQSRAQGDVAQQVRAISEILLFGLESHEDRVVELIREGRALIRQISEMERRTTFLRNALSSYVHLALVALEEERVEDYRKWWGEMLELLEETRALDPDFFKTPEGLQITGMIMNVSGQKAEAGALLAPVVDASDPGDEKYWTGAMTEAQYRMESGEYERVVKILTRIVPALEEKYLTAVEDEAIATAGKSCSEATRMLAFAYAHLNQWGEAVRSLERGKSLRLRYRAALRRSPEGKSLLELETKLYALSRGVPLAGDEFDAQQTEDSLGAKVSLTNKVLEAYRRQRSRLWPELLAAHAVADIARVLEADEAVVVLGVHTFGTMVAVICHGDEEQPSGRVLLTDWPLHRWGPLFRGEQEDGWAYGLSVPELNLDLKSLLLDLLPAVDAVIGQPLQPILRQYNVQRVTIIPHHLFHLVPFWALPSLENYDVVMSASAAHFIQARDASEPARRRALVVADPTRDLLASLAEADAVTRHLMRLDFDVERLDREQATENAIVAAVSGVSIFHFCGHGSSVMGDPSRSALLVSPQLSEVPAGVSDPLAHFAAIAQDWQEDKDSRSAIIPGFGRLYEQLNAQGQPLERQIEYGERGSLWGNYQDGKLTSLAEMWTAGDILVDSPLGDCRLAFLSACRAGGGGLDIDVDEYSGLPAALQLAGAATVVCSLWPVGDALTALYVDLFYRTLAKAPQPVDVGRVMRQVGRRLRRMKRERAVVLLNRLRRHTASPRSRFLLEGFAARVAAGEPHPFQHPYHWGAFYATGANQIQFRQGATT